MNLPLTGWPDDIYPQLKKNVRLIVNDEGVKKFYIGRSVDPSQRASEHGCDEIISLYYSDSVDNAKKVESYLIENFYYHPKCVNEAPHSGGGTSEEYGNYVYLAIWWW